MKTFVQVIGKKTATTKAQEVALGYIMDLQTEIAAIEAAKPSLVKQQEMYVRKMKIEAERCFEESLGNTERPNLDKIIETYATLKAIEVSDNPYTQKIKDAEERLAILKEILALFPENVDSIVVSE